MTGDEMGNYVRAGFVAIAVMLAFIPASVADAYFDFVKLVAEDGIAQSQFELGNLYTDGKGVPQDSAEGVKWYRMAAEQGHVGAQVMLGYIHYKGEGVPQDYAEAFKWLRMAAEQGQAQAQLQLGYMYANGHGVPQSDVLAHMWFNIGSALGEETATRNRDRVAEWMNPAEMAEAQKLAREWFAKHN